VPGVISMAGKAGPVFKSFRMTGLETAEFLGSILRRLSIVHGFTGIATWFLRCGGSSWSGSGVMKCWQSHLALGSGQ